MGERRALVLVPGLACDRDLYAEQAAALAEQVDVVVADVTRGASIAELAQHVLAHAPPEFALAGLSMGGYVALQMVRTARSRVTALALLDTSARPETPAQLERRRVLLELGRAQGFGAVLDALWPLEVAPLHRGDERLRRRFDAMCSRSGPAVFERQVHAIIGRSDSRPDLPGLDLPTLVLCGREDAITPLDGHEEIASAVPGAALVVLDDCGHLSTWEQPSRVTAALQEWLAR